MASYAIRNMQEGDREEIARLIFDSLNTYYQSIGRGPIFPGDDPLCAAVFFDVYEKTDPGEGIVAVDDETGAIIGSCFVHPRETHISLGIMNVHHEHFGRGVARELLTAVTCRGEEENLPVRLVSSCLNLDSFSLYTRGGFVPFQTFQDMTVNVPEAGLEDLPSGIPGASRIKEEQARVRPARPEDGPAMAALEKELAGISRLQDYEYFIRNEEGYWHVSVIESESGGLDGYLVSCGSPDFNMLGPGVVRSEAQAAALIHAELDQQRGRSPILLVPVTAGGLVATLYSWGARNCEMHVAQSFGPAQKPAGIIMPTFLPETG